MTLPDSDGALSFLQDIGLTIYAESLGVRLVGDRRVASLFRDFPRVELRPFDSRFAGEALANLLYERLEGFVSTEALVTLHEAAAELTANAVEHALSPSPPLMAAFTNHPDGNHEYLVVAVGDLGIGVESSLRKTHQVHSEEEALRLAFRELVSGTGEKGRGRGLFEVERTVRSLGGFTVLRSGSARRQEGPSFGRSYSAFPLPGTIVGALVPRFGEDGFSK
jgi:anti-sigma regulatory factor (Ser/Thr protein kinase)